MLSMLKEHILHHIFQQHGAASHEVCALTWFFSILLQFITQCEVTV